MNNIEEKFQIWISQYPESAHPMDEDRYYDFIDAVVAHDNYISKEWLENKFKTIPHNMSKEQVADRLMSFSDLIEYGKHRVKKAL